MKKQAGFTLIETLMAMAIFTIGILALFGMQSAAITENVVANKITTGSTWAADQVEQLISLSYDDLEVNKTCDHLDDRQKDPAYYREGKDFLSSPPYYNIYWNVARGCTLKDAEDQQQPKHLRILVTIVNGNGTEELTATFNYIKQNVTRKNNE